MAVIRVVMGKGSIYLEGRAYASDALIPYVGQRVKAFVDDSIGGADAVCLTLEGEFIANAHNPELWASMRQDAQ